MRALALLLAAFFFDPSAHAACDPVKVLSDLRQRGPDGFVPGPRSTVTLKESFQPEEKKRVWILGEDYRFTNPTAGIAELFVISGSSLASKHTVWGVLVHAQTCAILEASELAHTGGGGL